MPCYLLIDTSASMTISSTARSKYAIAIHIAGGLAFACLDRVSPVGVVGVGGKDVRVRPSLSRGQVLQWLYQFRHFRYDEPTTLGRRIAELAPTLTSRALIIVLSDLHDPQAVPALRLMAQRHDCVALQLLDPAEEGLRGAGFVRVAEAETARIVIARGGTLGIDAATTARALKRAGVDQLLIQTDKPFVADLRDFFKSRNLLGRGAR
jgi:uncharacterized protein (DUF58 family)